jgi:hypothetical protein
VKGLDALVVAFLSTQGLGFTILIGPDDRID